MMFMIILARISDRFSVLIVSMMVTAGSLIWLFHPVVSEHTNFPGAYALTFCLASYIFYESFLISIYTVLLEKLILLKPLN